MWLTLYPHEVFSFCFMLLISRSRRGIPWGHPQLLQLQEGYQAVVASSPINMGGIPIIKKFFINVPHGTHSQTHPCVQAPICMNFSKVSCTVLSINKSPFINHCVLNTFNIFCHIVDNIQHLASYSFTISCQK